jgi:hypothetical protein
MRASKLGKGLCALVAIGVAFCALPMTASAAATIVVVNVDGAGEGFNDPTPRAPIGGNSGTTIGQQRLIAFQAAADIWGATLDSSVPIRIRAAFNPLTCSASSGVLGSAGAIYVWSDFPGAQIPGAWYHEALANKQSQTDLNPPGDPDDAYNGADLNAQFNSSIGTVAGCLTGSDWYYGLDGNHGVNFDLIAVLLHEFGHGLGFSSFVARTGTVGSYFFGGPGVFDLFVHDNTTNKDWTAMTIAERAASIKNGRNVVWTGANVTAGVPSVLSLGTPLLRVNSPAGIAGVYPVGTASFGTVLSNPGVTADMVLATDLSDASGASTTDACTAITNAASVAGKIAIVDRGSCGFVVKAKNVQNAGAIAMVVADNAAGTPPAGMSGTDATVTIPSVRITLANGNTIKAQLGTGVNATLALDMTVRAGADTAGHAMLNTPDPIVSGSSISHWDPLTFRNQLMEPAINSDLTHSVNVPEDLTREQMRDVGWFVDADLDGVPDSSDACLGSTLGGTVVIDGCSTGVTNTFLPATGCSINDSIAVCGDNATTHLGFTNCVTSLTNQLKDAGIITLAQKKSIQVCASRAAIP